MLTVCSLDPHLPPLWPLTLPTACNEVAFLVTATHEPRHLVVNGIGQVPAILAGVPITTEDGSPDPVTLGAIARVPVPCRAHDPLPLTTAVSIRTTSLPTSGVAVISSPLTYSTLMSQTKRSVLRSMAVSSGCSVTVTSD